MNIRLKPNEYSLLKETEDMKILEMCGNGIIITLSQCYVAGTEMTHTELLKQCGVPQIVTQVPNTSTQFPSQSENGWKGKAAECLKHSRIS